MKLEYTESDVQCALAEIANGKSLRKAAVEWGVPRSTLQDRNATTLPHLEAASHLQRLPTVMENQLTNWVLTQEALGRGVTHAQIRVFGQRLLALQGDHLPLGRHWISRFLARNPILKTKRQIFVDSVRVNNACSEVIRPWFQNLEIPAIKAIPASQRWNMDETGIMEGYGLNGLVVGHAEKRKVQGKQPGSRAWTSIIECISATGVSTAPAVIYKGKTVQQQWFPSQLDKFSGWYFTATENGWTTDGTALEWLEKVFIPQTKPRDRSARLLILDGHGSHETTDFLWRCLEHNIYVLFLPAHTSHVLQPLDLTIFSPLKRAYRKELHNLSSLLDSTPIGKRNFLVCYQKARQESIISSNIKAGWRTTGLWPVSVAKPLISPLLLENSNKPTALPFQDSQDVPILPPEVSNSSIELYTPKVRKDIHLQLRTLASGSHDRLPKQRLLFRKIVKGIDEKDYELGKANMKIRELEERLEQLKPKKRRKVQTSPNSKFVTTRAIYEAQIAAGDRQIEPIESESEGDSESTVSCIEVEAI
jgi:hypothetical protein